MTTALCHVCMLGVKSNNSTHCHSSSWNIVTMRWYLVLRPRQNGYHFADDNFKCIFVNEKIWIPIEISLKFVLKGPFNNIPAIVQIMAWRRQGDKPLTETMMVRFPTHICVTLPQWVKPWVTVWNLTAPCSSAADTFVKFQSSLVTLNLSIYLARSRVI